LQAHHLTPNTLPLSAKGLNALTRKKRLLLEYWANMDVFHIPAMSHVSWTSN